MGVFWSWAAAPDTTPAPSSFTFCAFLPLATIWSPSGSFSKVLSRDHLRSPCTKILLSKETLGGAGCQGETTLPYGTFSRMAPFHDFER